MFVVGVGCGWMSGDWIHTQKRVVAVVVFVVVVVVTVTDDVNHVTHGF